MKKIFAGALTLLAVLAVSCTVSEPDSTDIPVGSDARLVSLSYYGMNLMHVSYDAQRRVTEIRVGDPEEYDLYKFSYDPFEVVCEEWGNVSHYDENTGEWINSIELRERDRWHDVKLSTSGYITAMHVTSVDYTVAGMPEGDASTSHVLCHYDDEGHLTRINADSDVTVCHWDPQGRLTSVEYTEADTDHNGSYKATWEYSSFPNTHLQWDPMLPLVGPVQITGIFGKAPSYFVKSVVTQYTNQQSTEEMQFSYRLNSNGFVSQSLYGDEYDAMQYTWKYER